MTDIVIPGGRRGLTPVLSQADKDALRSSAGTFEFGGTVGYRHTNGGFVYNESLAQHVAYYKKSGGYRFYWRRTDDGLRTGANGTDLMSIGDDGLLYTSSGGTILPIHPTLMYNAIGGDESALSNGYTTRLSLSFVARTPNASVFVKTGFRRISGGAVDLGLNISLFDVTANGVNSARSSLCSHDGVGAFGGGLARNSEMLVVTDLTPGNTYRVDLQVGVFSLGVDYRPRDMRILVING